MTASPRANAALSALLWVIAVLVLAGGLLILFATPLIIGLVLPGLPVFSAGAALPMLFKYIAVLALAFAYLLAQAARDPVRYVAVVDVMAFLAIAAAIVDVAAAVTHAWPMHTGLIWARAVVRLIVAALLIAWRPRRSS